MRKIETRLLAAVLAGAVGAFAVTAALGHQSAPAPTTPVAVVQVAVPPGDVRVADVVMVRSEVDHRAARPAAAARPA
ncbi:hypothetical protein [Amycolatopsis jiangsuensis]|uniref:SAF domain-containing protein n=1 Tax=Amycolatopsis jiangsuensis TaxID=1181879 RepID=A0A840J017_9PSEU|nr:hypothetical protein [Amycolatopsis jiangsuensis]MBB4687420.1 hypothetical protein [Amycolatopsis jiangsuensis]